MSCSATIKRDAREKRAREHVSAVRQGRLDFCDIGPARRLCSGLHLSRDEERNNLRPRSAKRRKSSVLFGADGEMITEACRV